MASVALPQYQKAVERSRMAEAMQRLGDYASAQQVYYMHNNGFASDYAALNQGDIKVPEQTEVGTWDTDDSRWEIASASGNSLEKVTMSAQRMSGIFQGCVLTLSVDANGKIDKTCSGNADCCAAAKNERYEEGTSSSDGSGSMSGFSIPDRNYVEIYSENESSCLYMDEKDCSNSLYSGDGSHCYMDVSGGCANSVFTGKKSSCGGDYEACEGSTFYGGSACFAGDMDPGCNDTIYAANENGATGCCSGPRCPTGSPKCAYSIENYWGTDDLTFNSSTQAYELDGWHGDCCNPDLMADGCPTGVDICG